MTVRIVRAADVSRLLRKATQATGMDVGQSHDLLGEIGNWSPLEIVELCQAWQRDRGVRRDPNVVDVTCEAVG